LANKIFNSKCIIYSFEPTEFAHAKLKKNTSNFENIIPINKGVGLTVGEGQIYFNKPGSVLSSMISDGLDKHSESITLTTLDEFCDSNQIKKIHILKLDVEGYEFNCLKGSENILNGIDFIQFEFGNKQVSSRHFLSDFIELLDNFKIFRLVQDGFIEINKDPINEIFQTSNYIAMNKKLS
jgi:FkbM family methyltransferase